MAMVDGLWLMAYGFDLEKLPFGGGQHGVPGQDGPVDSPPTGPPKINIFAPWTSKNQYLRSLDL